MFKTKLKTVELQAPKERLDIEVLNDINEDNGVATIVRLQKQAQELAKRDHLKGQDMQNLIGVVDDLLAEQEQKNEDVRKKLEDYKELAMAGQRTLRGDMNSGSFDLSGLTARFAVPKEDFPDKGMDPAFYTLIGYNARELSLASAFGGVASTRHVSRDAEDYAQSYFETNKAVQRGLARLQFLNDACIIADLLYAGPGGGDNRYRNAGGMKSLKVYKQFQECAQTFQRALNTTGTGVGVEWVPTILSARLHDLLRLELRVAGYFAWDPMDSKIVQDPVLMADFIMFLTAEATTDVDDNSLNSTVSNLTTAAVTLTAVKGMVRSILSREADEDVIVGKADYIMSLFARAIRRGIEDAAVNGQGTAGASAAIDTPAPAAGDFKLAWPGLRFYRNLLGNNIDSGAVAPTVEVLLGAKGKMDVWGVYPEDGIWITSVPGYIRCLSLKDTAGTSVVLTQDKLGPNATFPRGTLGQMFGSDLAVSEFVPKDEDNTGLRAASGATEILYANKSDQAWKTGERRGTEVRRGDEILMASDRIMIVGSWRGDMKPVRTPSASFPIVAGVINVPTF